MANRRGIGESTDDFLYLGSKITEDINCSHEIGRQLLLGGKTMTNLDSVLKSRDITLLTEVRLVCALSLHSLCIVLFKALVFPLVMCGCDSWTIKNAECQNIDAFELRCWKRLLKVPWTAGRSKQSVLREINPEYSLEGLMLKLKLQYLGYLMQTDDSLETSLMLGKIEGRVEESVRG